MSHWTPAGSRANGNHRNVASAPASRVLNLRPPWIPPRALYGPAAPQTSTSSS